ncbi:hypothetical protein OESDEN_10679, partial [Oesophagostomum dentatum]
KPPASATNRSKSHSSHSSTSSKSRHKRKKKGKKPGRPPKPLKARKSLEPIGATPREKLDMIKKGMKRDSDVYPTLDDVPSDWDDEKKSTISKLKPKEQPLNKKELLIALGAKHQESAYPTLDDVASDWGSKEDEPTKKEAEEKRDAGNKEEVDFELELLESDRKPDHMKKRTARRKK